MIAHVKKTILNLKIWITPFFKWHGLQSGAKGLQVEQILRQEVVQEVITKWGNFLYYKVGQVFTKWGKDYKVVQYSVGRPKSTDQNVS